MALLLLSDETLKCGFQRYTPSSTPFPSHVFIHQLSCSPQKKNHDSIKTSSKYNNLTISNTVVLEVIPNCRVFHYNLSKLLFFIMSHLSLFNVGALFIVNLLLLIVIIKQTGTSLIWPKLVCVIYCIITVLFKVFICAVLNSLICSFVNKIGTLLINLRINWHIICEYVTL